MASKDKSCNEAGARRAGSTDGKRVLCAFDNSDAAARALQFAVDKLVDPEKGDRIVLFQAIQDTRDFAGLDEDGMTVVKDLLKQECLSNVENLKCKLPVETEAVVLVGDPRVLIPDYVEKHPVDLVVVGRRGRGMFKSMVLGSVSNYLVSHSPVPVVVVGGTCPKERKEKASDRGEARDESSHDRMRGDPPSGPLVGSVFM
ncbi:universal stress protein family protein [Klebsormidium nitens]|uniref:Universal stress protein family protein n=1 Tax=Klebsormidium nitens TaxID=105231 RepID=A0A1Y1I788_KLENI|nr:universal stress protein family protein [Klebsormidium nitens]|eukprot:GAQ83968.1 universal stress protein family protein [Klebsormidium nitens]